jgi:hypothetical protein
MPRKSKAIEYKELTEEELETIHWRATRGCHFEGTLIWTSKYGIEVIENDVPLLIAEVRRLRGILTKRALDSAPPYTVEELDIITNPRLNGALQDPPSQ